MTAQVLFFNVFPEKDPHLNAVENVKSHTQFQRDETCTSAHIRIAN